MSHGKETPRQKMIGMMYLVLMAMLALNVSKDVLDAFAILDEGLVTTLKTIETNNKNIISDIDQQYNLNQSKVGKSKVLADSVSAKAGRLVKLIQDNKIKIIKVAEGENSPAILEDGSIDGKLVQAKDNKDAPENIMMGDNNDRAGKKVKEEIEKFRIFLLDEVIKEGDTPIRNSLESLLHTADPEHGVDTKAHTWESDHFSHIPLGGVISIMSGLQINIRNAESDVLNYLSAGIGKEDFKFNKLDATVIPNSNYIIQGGEYSADVFLAASDSTATPKIYVTDNPNPYDSVLNETTQNWEYKRRPGLSYDSLDVVKGSGKGVFSKPANALGTKSWGGIIELTGPTGAKIRKPFKREYTVAKSSVVVSATKMNVFYLGVENPVTVSVPGFQSSQISISVTNASATKKGGSSYIIKPKRPGNSFVNVSAMVDGVKKPMGRQEFRVKTVPDPYPTVAGKRKGVIKKSLLLAQIGMKAEMGKDFDFELTYIITGFDVAANVGGFFKAVPSKSYKFTRDQMSLIKNLNKGDRLNIENITAVGPDGSTRNLSPIILIIN